MVARAALSFALLLTPARLLAAESFAEGTLEVIAVDENDLSLAGSVHALHESDGAWLVLRLPASQEPPRPGTRVWVAGDLDGGIMDVRELTRLPALPVPAATVMGPEWPQARTLNIIDFGYADAPIGFSQARLDELHQFYFAEDNPSSVVNWFREVSYGKLSFTGNIYQGNVSFNRPPGCGGDTMCDAGQGSAAVNDLCSQHPEFCSAQHIILLGPISRGFGTMGGSGGLVGLPEPGQSVHELGHNLGLGHANTYGCGPDAYYPYWSEDGFRCGFMEYGDGSSAMGGYPRGHYSCVHKMQLQWLTAPNVATAGEGVYALAPLELTTTELQCLRIDLFYTLEYRRPLGQDSFLQPMVQVRSPEGLSTANLVPGGTLRDVSYASQHFHAVGLAMFPEAAIVQVHLGDEPPLALSGLTIDDVTDSAAVVHWTTPVAADSYVELGKTYALGQAGPFAATAVTAHTVTLSGLEDDTLYYVRARSAVPGNVGYVYGTFTTLPTPVVDSDGDGLDDADEESLGTGVLDPDSDDDGLLDGLEVLGGNPTDPLDANTDDDFLEDGEEDVDADGIVDLGETDPTDPDTDDDGRRDGFNSAAGDEEEAMGVLREQGCACRSSAADASGLWLVLGELWRRRRRARQVS